MWDKKSQQIINNESAFVLNSKLVSIINELNELEAKCHFNKEPFTIEIVIKFKEKLLNPSPTAEQKLTFNQFYAKELKNDPSQSKRYLRHLRRTLDG